MDESTFPLELPRLSIIKERRQRLKWTQKQLGAKLRNRGRAIGHTTISKIENDEDYHASYQTIGEIMNILNEAMFGSRKLWHTAVGEIMNKPVVSVTSRDRVIDAIEKLEVGGFSQLPVYNEGNNMGTVSEHDILNHALEPDELIGQIAGPKLPVVDLNTNLREARRMLLYEPALLVSNDNEIEGIVTRHDIFAILRKELKAKGGKQN